MTTVPMEPFMGLNPPHMGPNQPIFEATALSGLNTEETPDAGELRRSAAPPP